MEPGAGTLRHVLSEGSNRCATPRHVRPCRNFARTIRHRFSRLSLPRCDDDISTLATSSQRQSGALEALLPDAQCLDLRVQGRPRNAELCRRPEWPGHAPPARSQCRLDPLSFLGGEIVRERLNRTRRPREFPTQPALVDDEGLCLANDDGALDDVL